MLSITRRFKRDQRGSALVLLGLSIVVLVGFTALAVDGGYLYFRHTRLQDIADATALAAAIEIVEAGGKAEKKKTDAFAVARGCATRHGLSVSNANTTTFTADIAWGNEQGQMTVSYPDGLNKVMVTLHIQADSFYARAIGTTSTPVGVTSIVQIGMAEKQQGNLVPVAFFWGDYEWYTKYNMTLTPNDELKNSGNYGFLDYDSPSNFKDYLMNGYPGVLYVGQEVETLPGVMAGPVDDAIGSRVSSCTHGCEIKGADSVVIDESCRRVVIVPIVSRFFEDNGKHYVEIAAFAKFFIESYDKDSKILTGWFLQTVEPSEITEGNPEFTTQSVRLIK